MTSILTNFAANTALMNLENTNNQLQNVQSQISTGLKVSSAADNAAYFSIATTMRSDSGALGTVSDTLNLGGSSLDVATSALGQIQTTLNDIKNQLINATSPGVNRTAIQEQISQDQAQLKNIANSATFNGQNFLSVNSGAQNYDPVKEFVASFSRDSSGAVSVGTIGVDTTGTALFDAAVGVYGTNASGAIANAGASAAAPNTQTDGNANAITGLSLAGPTFTAAGGGNPATLTDIHYTQDANATTTAFSTSITVNNATANSTLSAVAVGNTVTTAALAANGDTAGAVATSAGHQSTFSDGTLTFYIAENTTSAGGAGAYQYYKYTATNLNGGGALDSTDGLTTGTYTSTTGGVTTTYNSATTATSAAWAASAASGVPAADTHANGTGVSIFNMNIAGATDSAGDQAYLTALQNQVNNAISSVTAAQSSIGTARARITEQSSFVSSLQTSLNDGIGSLVDADLNVASTKLQALQVQQQLGVQSLSIANQSTQAVLKLFQ